MTTAAAPRSYRFRPPARLDFHAEFTTTCPSFCTDRHTDGAVEHPVDVVHSTSGNTLDLLVAAPGQPAEECSVLETFVNLRPYSLDPAQRVPHAVIAVLASEESPALTPDDLAEVIDRFAAHLDRLRQLHAVLVQAVAEHQGGGQ